MMYARVKGPAKAMKAGSFRDTVRKTVQLLVRDNIEVLFRGFQPMVLTQGDKIVRMVLPEVGDDAPEELIEAMAGFIDHECGHIFYTDFATAAKLGNRKPLLASLLNIVEDIRLEKLLPRDLPGTKDNLERMYEKMIVKFWGTPIQNAINRGATDEQMLSVCIVVSFRALAGQKVFQRYMDDNNLWRFMTPLLKRYPTLAADLQGLETYDDVVRCVDKILEALDGKTKQQMDDDAAQQQQQQQDDPDMDAPPSSCSGDGDADDDQEPEEGEGDGDGDPTDEEDGDEAEGGDAGDDEGNSSEGDEADDGEGGDGDEDGDETDAGDGEGDDDSEDAADSDSGKEKDSKGGKGKGDGEGEDDPDSDEEGGDCKGDEDQSNPNEDGDGDGEPGEFDDEDDGEGSGGGKSNRTITDAVKSLEATQRKVLYLHKSKRRSVERIAAQMKMSEDEVKATLKSARRNLVEYMTGDK